jgi:hypothetical protein
MGGRRRALFTMCDSKQARIAWIGIALNTLFIAWIALWLAVHRELLGANWIYLPFIALIGLFIADILSGVVHWTTDTWFDESYWTRIVSIAREHHLYPQNIVGYGFRDYVGYASWPGLIFFAPWSLWLTLGAEPGPLVYLGVTLAFMMALTIYFGTYAHRLGHKQADWAPVRFLQRHHLIMSPRHHRVHHDNTVIRYCVLNGWANYPCDAIGFWRGLERLISFLTGAVPRRNDRQWVARFEADPRSIEPRSAAERQGAD